MEWMPRRRVFFFAGPALSCLLLLLVGRAFADNAAAVPGELLVGTNPQAVATTRSVSALAGKVGVLLRSDTELGLHRVHLRAGLTMEAAAAQLRAQPGILFVEPNYIRHTTATPDDAYYANQYAPSLVQADLAWSIWRPKQAVTIAIVDTGIDFNHPDLTNKILRDGQGNILGYNAIAHVTSSAQDDEGHGTHCAGIAAAQVNNGIGVAGIAGWDGQAGDSDATFIKLMPVKALDSTGSGNDADIAEGIKWAVDHGAKVISLSLGGTDYSSTLAQATNYAYTAGALVMAAAGNDGQSVQNYPAANPNVISVAASDSTDTLTSFSQYGSWISVAAPGDSILSTLPTYTTDINNYGYSTNYDYLSGTSMATPLVAGEAALLFAQNPALSNSQVRQLIVSNVDTVNPYIFRSIFRTITHSIAGGRVNVFKALRAATGVVGASAASDFNGDGKTDILWQNTQSGNASVWLSPSSGFLTLTPVGPSTTPVWQIVGVADFNADGKPDILWRNTQTGDVAVWYMNGTAFAGSNTLASGVSLAWQIVSVADFNADGKPDILWRNTQTGDVAVWYMSGATIAGSAVLATGVALDWSIVGTGDFNGDGKPDILWQNRGSGSLAFWFLNGVTYQGYSTLSASVPVVWSVVGTPNVNSDGKPDILWRNTQTGDVAVWYMNGTTFASSTTLASGVSLSQNIVGPR